MFRLAEPWRTNFLQYVAARVGQDGRTEQEEVVRWLAEDRELCSHVRLLLYVWTGE